jgi:hypothetical protein
MRRTASTLLFVVFLTISAGSATDTPKRRIPCKTPVIASSCYCTHGRLGFYNGNPAFRLWKIGTNRLFGIYCGPSSYHGPWAETTPLLDNEDPEFPADVVRTFKTHREFWVPHRIFADFEVCPLEPEKPGTMQAACVESAKNIFVEKN